MENKILLDGREENPDKVLDLLNQCLYAYVYAENKAQEKQQARNIKILKKALKRCFGKKIRYDKESMVFVFKN